VRAIGVYDPDYLWWRSRSRGKGSNRGSFCVLNGCTSRALVGSLSIFGCDGGFRRAITTPAATPPMITMSMTTTSNLRRRARVSLDVLALSLLTLALSDEDRTDV
jgi:hypothetical protein